MKIRYFLTLFKSIKVQLTVGLLLFASLLNAQIDTVFWNDFNQKKLRIYGLLSTNLDSALSESNSLMRTIKEPYDSLAWSGLMMLQGHIYADLGRYEKANEKYLKTARIRELLQDKSHAGAAYQSLANLDFYLRQYDRVFLNAQKAIKYYSINKEQLGQIASVNNLIGISNYHLNENDSALYYFNRSLRIYDSSEDAVEADYSMVYENMGLVYINLKKYDLGIEYFKKVTIKRNGNGGNAKLVSQYKNLTYAYFKQEKYDSAEVYLHKAEAELPAALTLRDKSFIVGFKLDLLRVTEKNIDSLSTWLRTYRILKDSLVAREIKSNIQDAQTKYEVEKKDAAIKLANEESAKLEAQNTAKNRLLIAAVAVFLMLLLTGIYFYRNAKQKERLSKLQLEVKNQELNELLSNQENEVFSSILKGQEKERERIAMDLHDRLGGTLAALRMSLRKPAYQIEKDDFSILETAIAEVRSISHNLSTGLINKYGLNEAVSKLFSTLENSKGIKFSVFFHPDTAKLGQSVGIELYRIVQELVSNTLKHANASEISLKTSVENWQFTMQFQDNGEGFDMNKNQGGIGMENIKTRVKNIDGNLEVDSKLGSGSTFTVTLSLNPLKG